MLADFNKQIEALNTTSQNEEMFKKMNRPRSASQGQLTATQQSQSLHKSSHQTYPSSSSKNQTHSNQKTYYHPPQMNSIQQHKHQHSNVTAKVSSSDASQSPSQPSQQLQVSLPASAQQLDVSPVMEQTLQQQQLLIQQQQQMIILQKEQNKLHQQLQEQLQKSQQSSQMANSGQASKSSGESASVPGTPSKKDRRRLPQPTVEEIQGAVQAIVNFSHRDASSPQAIGSPTLARKTATGTIPLARPRSSASTILPFLSNLPFLLDYRTLSSYINSLQALPNLDHKGGEILETQSETDSKSKRCLPSVPLNEEPVTAAIANRKLFREKLGRSVTSLNPSNKMLTTLRPSSSLDSYHSLVSFPKTFGPTENISTYSSLSDIANMINASAAALNLKPSSLVTATTTTTTTSTTTSNTTTSLAQKSLPNTSLLNSSSQDSSLFSPRSYYSKVIKQQLPKDELKTTAEERRLLELKERDRSFLTRSDTDTNSLINLYTHKRSSSLSPSRPALYNRRNFSDSKLVSNYDEISGLGFKSYEYESLYQSRSPQRHRPLSSMTEEVNRSRIPLSMYFEGKERGLRESFIPNFIDNSENEVLTRLSHDLRRFRRQRSEGSLDEAFLNGLNRNESNLGLSYYDELNEQSKLRKHLKREPRSWHSSPYASEDEDERIIKEEKATEIRNQIARRRQQLAESGYDPDISKLYNYPIGSYSNNSFYSSGSYRSRNEPQFYSPTCYHEHSSPVMNRRSRFVRDPYYSRSLDTGYDDYGGNYDYPYLGYSNKGDYL